MTSLQNLFSHTRKAIVCVFFFVFSTTLGAQAVRNIAEETVERTLKIFGRETIESSDVIIKNAFNEETFNRITKMYDDEILERLAKDINVNPNLKALLSKNKTAVKMWGMMGETSARNNAGVVKYFSSIMDELGERGFKEKYIFKESGNTLLIRDKNNRAVASVYDDIISAKPWKGNKDLNPLLNEYKMIPNVTYRINGQCYKTLKDGRYQEIRGVITHLPQQKALRSTEMQGLSKKIKDGVAYTKNGEIVRVQAGYAVYKDDGGHIIANMFGGGSEMYNYIPMSKKLNRQGGAWAVMEKTWEKSLREGKKVDYKITPVYKTSSQRPDNIFVTYEIDGKRITELFDNNIF